jgi:hypothetical protein
MHSAISDQKTFCCSIISIITIVSMPMKLVLDYARAFLTCDLPDLDEINQRDQTWPKLYAQIWPKKRKHKNENGPLRFFPHASYAYHLVFTFLFSSSATLLSYRTVLSANPNRNRNRTLRLSSFLFVGFGNYYTLDSYQTYFTVQYRSWKDI